MSDDENPDKKDLERFANADGQPNQPGPRGHSLVRPTQGLADHAVGARPVAVPRDEQKIMQRLKMFAAKAGTDWFYRIPVKTKDGRTDWIMGPSIKLANTVHFVVGNLVLETREVDVGDAWVFYARETDLEGGSSMERAYRQHKGQSSIRTKDAERQRDIAYQIGQSKAIRNVICNMLAPYCDFAFEEAQESLVEKIGRDLAGWRDRTVKGIAKMPCDLVRVERVIGRASKDWLAADIAAVIAMMQSIADGMANVDDTFPPIEPSEPAASGSPSPTVGGGGGASVSAADTRPSAAASDSTTTDPTSKSKAK